MRQGFEVIFKNVTFVVGKLAKTQQKQPKHSIVPNFFLIFLSQNWTGCFRTGLFVLCFADLRAAMTTSVTATLNVNNWFIAFSTE